MVNIWIDYILCERNTCVNYDTFLFFFFLYIYNRYAILFICITYFTEVSRVWLLWECTKKSSCRHDYEKKKDFFISCDKIYTVISKNYFRFTHTSQLSILCVAYLMNYFIFIRSSRCTVLAEVSNTQCAMIKPIVAGKTLPKPCISRPKSIDYREKYTLRGVHRKKKNYFRLFIFTPSFLKRRFTYGTKKKLQ